MCQVQVAKQTILNQNLLAKRPGFFLTTTFVAQVHKVIYRVAQVQHVTWHVVTWQVRKSKSILFSDLRDFVLLKGTRPREVLTLGTYLYSQFQSSRIIQQWCCSALERTGSVEWPCPEVMRLIVWTSHLHFKTETHLMTILFTLTAGGSFPPASNFTACVCHLKTYETHLR